MRFNDRFGVTVMFLVHGMIFGNWVARIPDIKAALDLSDGQLGQILLGMPVGILIGLPTVSGLIVRFGSRRMTIGTMLLFAAAMAMLGFMPNGVALFFALIAFGLVSSMNDVSINSQGVAVENLHNRSIMSSFHAAFSIGGVFGALMGAFFTGVGVSTQGHLVAAAIFSSLIGLAVSPLLLEVESERQTERKSPFTLPARALWGLGIIAFFSSIGEGAMADWSGVFMRSEVKVSDTLVPFGFAAFSAMMTIGRISGDYLIERFSPRFLIIFSGVLAGSGLGILVALPALPTAILGFAMVGIGLSYIIPLMFALAGQMPNLPPGAGIAGVATLGYSGFLAGPPIIGLLAEATSLRVSFALLAVAIASLILWSYTVRGFTSRRATLAIGVAAAD